MSELTPVIEKAVEIGAEKLLNHFKGMYGAIYFVPLWVNAKTPSKIAPMVSQTIEEQMLVVQENNVTVNMIDDKIWAVFDVFVDKFYDSLSFIGKWLMKWFELKMSRNDCMEGLKKRKVTNPTNYQTWRENINLILEMVFGEIVVALQNQGKTVHISNGEKEFSTAKEAADAMKFYQ